MSRPLRENLEVFTDRGGTWVRCTRCFHVLCQIAEDWKRVCRRKLLPPTQAGPHMRELVGQFLLEQLCCPFCGVLLNSDLVERQKDEEKGRAK